MKTAIVVEAGSDMACCEPSVRPALTADGAHESARILKALADPNRLRLLSIVKAGDGGGTCVCDLTAGPGPAHRLTPPEDSGRRRTIGPEKRGTWAYYSLVPGALERVATMITRL